MYGLLACAPAQCLGQACARRSIPPSLGAATHRPLKHCRVEATSVVKHLDDVLSDHPKKTHVLYVVEQALKNQELKLQNQTLKLQHQTLEYQFVTVELLRAR